MKVPRWEDAVKHVRKRLVSKHEGEKTPEAQRESSIDALSADGLVAAFSKAIDVMERENVLLEADSITEAVALLSEKTAAIDHLNHLIDAVREAGSLPEGAAEPLQSLQGRFDEVAEHNRIMLQRSLDTQSTVMKILVESAVEETQHGYSRSGKAGVDSSRATFSLDSEV